MAVEVVQHRDSIVAFLDIPSFVYAREPVGATLVNDTLSVSFPFGLGEMKFTLGDDALIPVDKSRATSFRKTESRPYRVEDLSWESGEEELKGSLYLPESKDRKPLLIRIHGSSNSSRENWEYRSWGDYFARKGIATVVYDRRGFGESSRNSKDEGFDQLANDVIALINELKERDDIDPDRIILNGASQAAYISFIVNSKCDAIDFMILQGAPSVAMIEQERQSLIYRMRANAEPQEFIDEALSYQHLYFHYIISGNHWNVLEYEIGQSQDKVWSRYIDQPRHASDLRWWRANFNAFLPEEMIPLVKIPVLIFYGENDLITPPSIMTPHFDRILGKVNDSYKIVICAGVGHTLEESFRKDRWGNIVFPQRPPVMFSEIEKWLDRYVFGGR